MTEELAKKRFMTLNLMRFTAIIIVGVGIAILGGKLPLDPIAGYLFLVIGALDFFLIPKILKRAWQKQDQ
jgi:hypothetical protein